MKIDKLTLDSNVLISLLTIQEENCLDSKKFMEHALKNGVVFLIPIIVLLEVFHSLRKNGFFDDFDNYNKFKDFFNLNCFRHYDLNFSFFNLFKEFDFFIDLKTSDAIIATSAFLTESLVISWDRQLLKHCYHGATPKEFLETFGE